MVFKPDKPWALNQSFTAELVGEFKTFGGNRYEGTRFWRFSTVGCGMDSFTQLQGSGAFVFAVGFTMPVNPDSLAGKLKLHYLTSDGEKLELTRKLQLDGEGRSARIETPIVPAVSFICEIEPGLQPKDWSDGTREPIERRLLNSKLLSLSGAVFNPWNPEGRQSVTLSFSEAPGGRESIELPRGEPRHADVSGPESLESQQAGSNRRLRARNHL